MQQCPDRRRLLAGIRGHPVRQLPTGIRTCIPRLCRRVFVQTRRGHASRAKRTDRVLAGFTRSIDAHIANRIGAWFFLGFWPRLPQRSSIPAFRRVIHLGPPNGHPAAQQSLSDPGFPRHLSDRTPGINCQTRSLRAELRGATLVTSRPSGHLPCWGIAQPVRMHTKRAGHSPRVRCSGSSGG